MATLLKIQFTISESERDVCEAFLAQKVPHGWEETPRGDTLDYCFFLEDHPLGMEILAEIKNMFPESGAKYSEQESEDWAMAWKDFFNPVSCGDRFEILPPWLEKDGKDGMTHIIIEPKMAFGTGHHPTTSLCLEMIGELACNDIIREGMEFLDLGTGSGILGIGMVKLGLHGIGLDIDPQAIVCAKENAATNSVAEDFSFAVGSIESIDPAKTFDIVVANILSGPLIEMAGDIISHVRPGGALVLSGILGTQAEAVAAAYMRRGLPEPVITPQGEWAALHWERVEL